MAACTSVSPAMAPAVLSLCLLLQATLVLFSTVTPETSALRTPSKKPIRQSPFLLSQQDLKPLNIAPAAYDLALLNDDHLSAFEEQTAIENESKRAKDRVEIPTENIDGDITSNDVDFPNYYDSDKPKTLNYDYYASDPNFITKIHQKANTISNDPVKNNAESKSSLYNYIESENKSFPTLNIKEKNNYASSNNKESNDYNNIDENALKVDRHDDPNTNYEYSKERNKISNTGDFDLKDAILSSKEPNDYKNRDENALEVNRDYNTNTNNEYSKKSNDDFESKDASLNNKEFNDYNNIDENAMKADKDDDLNTNEGYSKESNEVPKFENFEIKYASSSNKKPNDYDAIDENALNVDKDDDSNTNYKYSNKVPKIDDFDLKDASSNIKESNDCNNIDENGLKVDKNYDTNTNEVYSKESNEVSKTDDFELLNEDYAQREMLLDTDRVRKKRESESTLNKTKPRAITGDTVLNIAGSVRDTIGELAPFASPPSRAPPPPRPSGATRLDTVVIRSAASIAPPLTEQTSTEADNQLVEAQDDGTVTAEVGAKVELQCDVPAESTGPLTWTRDNEIVGGVSVTRAGSLSVVAARGVAGVWRCQRANQHGQPQTLRIYERGGAAWLGVEGRRLDAGRAWLPAREGTTLTLACHADGGVPPPVLVWRVNPASQLLSHNRTTYKDGVATSWASVLATRELHNATITCEAKQPPPTYRREGGGEGDGGPEGGGAAAVMLHVTYPPTFSISRRPGFGRPLMAGRGAVLRCDVSANPTPQVAWTRQDQPLPQDTVVAGAGWAEARWVSVSLGAAGWYRCTCAWGGQTYSSIGYFLMLLPEIDADGNLSDAQRCPLGPGNCRRPDVSESRAAGSGAVIVRGVSVMGVTPRVGADRPAGVAGVAGVAAGWRGVWCRVCGAGARARWLHGARAHQATLLPPDSADEPHCRRTYFTAPDHDEVWCVAVNAAGGDVAVFPPLAPRPSPSPPPPPAAPQSASRATSLLASSVVLVLLAISTHIYTVYLPNF